MSTTIVSRLARGLIAVYPRPWRVTYAAEALDLLAARAPTWGDVANLALHLVYTYAHPDLSIVGSDASLQERLALLMRALRSSEIAVFWAFVAAMIAWLQFGGLVDGGPYMSQTTTAGSWPLFGVRPANGISAALAIQSAAVDVAMLAILAGGVPLIWAAWRSVPAVRRYFLVPVAAVIGAIAPGIVALVFFPRRVAINLTFESPVSIAYCVWFVALAAVSVLVLSRAVAHGQLGSGLVRFALVPTTVATVALLLLLGATIAWGIAAHQEFPQLFDSNAIAAGHVTLTSWLLDVLVMAVATGAAVFATIRGAVARAATPAR